MSDVVQIDIFPIVTFVSRNVVVYFKWSPYMTFSYYNQVCRGQRRCVEGSIGRKEIFPLLIKLKLPRTIDNLCHKCEPTETGSKRRWAWYILLVTARKSQTAFARVLVVSSTIVRTIVGLVWLLIKLIGYTLTLRPKRFFY